MFCSKCGKTLPYEAANCPSCGVPVGESRFEGSPYTSAQAHIRPDDDVQRVMTEYYTTDYTRINYTGAPDAAEQGDVDARTTYRPTYGGDIVPEEMRRDMRAAVKTAAEQADNDEAPVEEPAIEEESVVDADAFSSESTAAEEELFGEETPSYIDEDDDLRLEALDLSQFRARPIESAGQSGISEDVSEMMQELEAEPQPRLRGFGRRRPVYDDYVEDSENYDAAGSEPQPEADEQSEVFDDIDEEEFDEMRHSSFGLKQLLKIVIAVVVAAALIVAGVMWFNYIRDNQSAAPIENVREQLYLDGVALIKQHASTENVESVLNSYTASSDLVALQTQLSGFSTAIAALQPSEATENEQIFIAALTKIEANITNCIISDAIAVGANDASAVAESDNRWKVVNDSISMLEAATSTAELTAIINGEVVDVTEKKPEATPTPEPKVNYNTLSKGDKSDEVVDMQTRLIELGYLNEKADGAFGGKTQTAVKVFQQVAGLPITGIADSDTLTALYAADAPKAE